MPRYPVEEALLREPNLWVPGKKPVGSVKIDNSHPLSRGLLQYWLYNQSSSSEKDLVTGNDILETHRTTQISGVKDGQRALISTAVDSRCYSSDVSYRNKITDKFTAFIRAEFPTPSSANFLFGQTTVGSANYDWGVYISNSASRVINLYVKTSAGVKAHVMTGVYTQNTPVLICLIYDGAFIRGYIDGKPEGTTTQTGNVETTGPAIGHDIWSSTLFGVLTYTIYYSGIFNRALSESEVKSLYRDPYQFLIPS